MKEIIITVLLHTFILSTVVSAQKTVHFEDGKTLVLNGTPLCVFPKFNDFNASQLEQNEHSFYKIEGDTIEIAIYGELDNKFVDLNIYRFHRNQINYYYLEVKEQLDENEKVLHYYIYFTADEERPESKPFKNTTYPFGFSDPEYKNSITFLLSCNTKEELEKLYNLIKIE
jgi:protein associated with RNAse G/E